VRSATSGTDQPPTPSAEREGILILGLAAFFFSLFSLAGKAISAEISSAQMILVRSVFMVPVLALWARRKGHPLIGGERKFLLFLRGLLGTVSLFAFFYALKRLPLADTVLIFQVHPLFVAALAPLFLKERNRPLHWLLLGVSLAGVVLVVGPTGEGTWDGRLSALICCVLASFVYILVRFLRRTEATLTIALSFPAVSLLVFGPAFAIGFPGFEWVAPTAIDWVYLSAMSVAAVFGQVLMTLGLGKVPAARATGLSNLQVAFALFYGILFFGELPGWVTLAGAFLIVSAQVALSFGRGTKITVQP